VRWERFRAISASYAWGIYGAMFYHIQAPTGAAVLGRLMPGLVGDGLRRDGWQLLGDGTACTPGLCLHTGDLNCDGTVNFGDINPFVMFLSAYDQWASIFLDCNPANGDINFDGTYGQGSFGDINPFVALVTSGQGPCP